MEAPTTSVAFELKKPRHISTLLDVVVTAVRDPELSFDA
jgi:hypothetical protein